MAYNSLRTSPTNLANFLPAPRLPNIVDPGAAVRARADERRVVEERDAQQRHDKALEQMLKDPRNAEYYSRSAGVPITPELRALLAEPEKAQRLAEANSAADKMGVKSFETKRIFAQKYMESGNLVEAAAAVEGMDTREPLSRYQEEMVGVQRDRNDVMRERNANGGGRPVTIPADFSTNVEKMLDRMRGVKFADQEKTMLLPGSSAPLSPDVTLRIANRAASITQQTRNPIAAVQQAFEELGGELALEDSADSPFGYAELGFRGLLKPKRELGRAKYRTLRQAGEPTHIPTPNDFSATFAPAPFMESGVPAGLDDLVTQERLRQGDLPQVTDQYERELLEGVQPSGQSAAQAPAVGAIDDPRAPDVRGSMGWKTGQPVPELRQAPLPIRVQSVDEARSLPQGTKFITPDGRIKVR